jgi:hypothetical protein
LQRFSLGRIGDCDLIGPANIYFMSSNMANPIRPPKVDAVWLEPNAKFNNGFVFNNCIFRNCSFQRITMFASVENFQNWKDNPNINWISIPPSESQIAERLRILQGNSGQQLGVKLSEERELLEHKPQSKTANDAQQNDVKSNSPQ